MTKDTKVGTARLFVLGAVVLLAACGNHHRKVHRFEDVERWVPVFEDPEREAWQKPDEVVRRLELKPRDTVADIGAGTGYFTRRFAAAVGPQGLALGLEVATGMVAYMEKDAKRLGLRQYQARVVPPDDPQLASGSVDLAFICDTYHHIENRVGYLKNLAPALKSGGRVVIVDFYDRPLPVGPRHGKLSEDRVKEEFEHAGYRLTRSHDFLPYQYFLEFQPAP